MIRHGETIGNSLKRYIGSTDESLSYVGIQGIKDKQHPSVESLYVSPRRRCVETAKIIYPQQQGTSIYDLRECNFGDFENKNYQELADNVEYQRWIDSNGTLPFPNGESLEEFSFRCIRGFTKVIEECFANKHDKAAIVTHGGVIMNIMAHFTNVGGDFYSWFVENGEGYEVQIDQDSWGKKQEITHSLKMTYDKRESEGK